MSKRSRNRKRDEGQTPRPGKPKRRGSAKVRAGNNQRRQQLTNALRRLGGIALKTSVRGWVFFVVVATVLAFRLDVDDAISRRLKSKPPATEIMYFQKEGLNYRLIDPTNVVLEPSQRELEKGYFSVPINLAVHNQEKTSLEATRVEITYPKGLRVIPEGRPKIDPMKNTLIYEHNLRSLDPVTSFTPLDTIDIIYINYAVKGVRTSLYLSDDIIAAVATAGLELTDRPYGVDIGVKVFARDRPPVGTKVHLSVDTSKAFEGGLASTSDLKSIPLKKSDVPLFRAVSKRLEAASRVWEVKVKNRATTLALAKTRYGRGSYNGLLLDGKATEVFVDHDGDGMLDYMLEDSTAPRSPDQKLVPSRPEPLTDMQRPDEVELI
jgi:hypothetical protein